MAFIYLITCCDEEISYSNVLKSNNIDRPDGDVYLSWKRLSSKHKPKIGTSMVLVKNEFNKFDVKKIQDPYECTTELDSSRTILRSLRSELNDTDLIIHILNILNQIL